MWHIVRSESAQTIKFSRWVGNLLLLPNESWTTALPRWEILLHGAFSLERKTVVSSVGNWPDGNNPLGRVRNVVQVACAVELHGARRRDVLLYFLDFRRWDFPWLKTFTEFSASFKLSIWGHSGGCGSTDFCRFTNKTLKVISVSCEILEGLVRWLVNFLWPCRLEF